MSSSDLVKREEKKALIKLIKDVVIESGTKIVETVPVIGPAAGLIKGLVENSKNLFDATNKQKLYDYYMGIYELDDDKEKYITNENLAFIIKKLLQDDEEQKSNFYSRLTVNIARSEYSKQERIDFISVLSKISCSDIDMAVRIFVHEKFNIKTYNNIQEQLVGISKTRIGNELKSLNVLLFNGLIYDPVKGKAGVPHYAMTEFMKQFLYLIIDESKLTPESLSLERKDKVNIFFEQNHEYMGAKEMYDERIIKPLKDMEYSVIIMQKMYGQANVDADMYIAINEEKPFTVGDDGTEYLSLIMLPNEEQFFAAKRSQPSHQLVPAKYLFDDGENNEANLSEIKWTLKEHIDFMMNFKS